MKMDSRLQRSGMTEGSQEGNIKESAAHGNLHEDHLVKVSYSLIQISSSSIGSAGS